MDQVQAVKKVGWRVSTWAEAVDISRAYVYELLDAGAIESVKIGAARIITTDPKTFLDSQRPEPRS